jgi:hypothetical protein
MYCFIVFIIVLLSCMQRSPSRAFDHIFDGIRSDIISSNELKVKALAESASCSLDQIASLISLIVHLPPHLLDQNDKDLDLVDSC